MHSNYEPFYHLLSITHFRTTFKLQVAGLPFHLTRVALRDSVEATDQKPCKNFGAEYRQENRCHESSDNQDQRNHGPEKEITKNEMSNARADTRTTLLL